MTNKEFNRRIQFFTSLDIACRIFQTGRAFIYRVNVCYNDNSKVEFFVGVPTLSLCDNMMNSNYIYFDKFNYSSFEIQFKYFEGFYNRCSNNQRIKLRSLSSLSALISLLDQKKESDVSAE